MAPALLRASALALISLLDGHLHQVVLATQVCGAHEGQSCDDEALSSLLQTKVQQPQQPPLEHEEHSSPISEGLLQELSGMLSQAGMAEAERAAVEDRWPFFHGGPPHPQPQPQPPQERDLGLPDAPTSTDTLWGGPSVAYSQATATKKAFNLEDVAKTMSCPGNNSGLPEDFQGIWWMDQYGSSSVSKDSDYPFAMMGLGETLMSFGDSSALVEGETAKCITPVVLYHGHQWAFFNNKDGDKAWRSHDSNKNTLTFCLNDDGSVQIRAKQLKDHFMAGPVPIPPHLVDSLEFEDAGNGYYWQPSWLMDMKMVKQSWGWDRVTTVIDQGVHTKGSLAMTMLTSLLSGLMPLSHYPLLQIIDGNGQKTKYYHELEAIMAQKVADRKVPADGQFFIPVPDV